MRRLFLADRVIPGTGAVPVEGGAVLVEGERILAMGRRADIGVPEGADVIAAPAGATLMPGLIDSHVHLGFSGRSDGLTDRADSSGRDGPVSLRALHYAQKTLVHGFTALRDLHAPGDTVIDLRNAINAGEVVGPRIKACGQGLTVTGGHMDRPAFAERDGANVCDGPDAFRLGVREEAKRGADFIKINACVGSRQERDIWWRMEMTPAEIRAACDEAHTQGLIVASHTSGGPPLTATIANGVDCVEHAHWIDDDCIELMAERGTVLVPTLLVNERNFELLGPGETANDWALASRDAKWISLEKARKAGIKVGAGTDAGFMIPHGTMNWRELALLVEGGYSPLEAVTCATANNADILGLAAGRLEKGMLADLLVVQGDPLADLSILADPSRLTVYLGGICVARGGTLLSPLV